MLPPRPTLFPYTTLFRSLDPNGGHHPVAQPGQLNLAADLLGGRLLVERKPIEPQRVDPDRKSTRLNSSHLVISYAVFCLKKKKHTRQRIDHGPQRRCRLD